VVPEPACQVAQAGAPAAAPGRLADAVPQPGHAPCNGRRGGSGGIRSRRSIATGQPDAREPLLRRQGLRPGGGGQRTQFRQLHHDAPGIPATAAAAAATTAAATGTPAAGP